MGVTGLVDVLKTFSSGSSKGGSSRYGARDASIPRDARAPCPDRRKKTPQRQRGILDIQEWKSAAQLAPSPPVKKDGRHLYPTG